VFGLSPDGRFLAVCDSAGTLTIWKSLATAAGHLGVAGDMRHEAKEIARACGDETLLAECGVTRVHPA
jgi:hypothetical protein